MRDRSFFTAEREGARGRLCVGEGSRRWPGRL